MVLDQGRGSLPFLLIHGEALVACASWSLGAAGVVAVDLGTPWEAIVESEEPFVLHDPLCPMTPPTFIASCVAAAVGSGRVVVAVRPVTDTVKPVEGGQLGDTIDRETLLLVTSPVVLPPPVLAVLDGLPEAGDGTDLVALVIALAERFGVLTMTAPPEGRRVADADDVMLLEALTQR